MAGFCIGPFGGNERTWKPFNPILGETFELDLPSNGVRFLAEQVQLVATEVSAVPPVYQMSSEASPSVLQWFAG